MLTHYDRDRLASDQGLDPCLDARAELAAERARSTQSQPLRSQALHAIKSALVTSRLTLSDADAGHNPYESRLGRQPGNPWRGRGR